MRLEVMIGALVSGGLALGSAGCASDEEKICKKMFALVEKATGEPVSEEDQAKCEGELAAELAGCANKDKAVECYLALDDIKGVTACGKLCKGSDGPNKGAAEPAGDAKGCPSSAECMNSCNQECRAKHGDPVDIQKLKECNDKGGTPDECTSKSTNSAFTRCFRTCRGI